MLLPEIVENISPQAAGSLAVADYGLQALVIAPADIRLLFLVKPLAAAFNEELCGLNVPRGVKQKAICRLPVAAGAAGT